MLRPYQTGAVEGLLEAHRGGKTPLCVMATGTGKTHVFVEYARLARKRVMIIAERSEIVMQAHQKVVSTGLSVLRSKLLTQSLDTTDAWTDLTGHSSA
jgi:superfamily II DNA or RNA helicase